MWLKISYLSTLAISHFTHALYGPWGLTPFFKNKVFPAAKILPTNYINRTKYLRIHTKSHSNHVYSKFSITLNLLIENLSELIAFWTWPMD